jgi:Histidine phosphatase superfamily (branch 1)
MTTSSPRKSLWMFGIECTSRARPVRCATAFNGCVSRVRNALNRSRQQAGRRKRVATQPVVGNRPSAGEGKCVNDVYPSTLISCFAPTCGAPSKRRNWLSAERTCRSDTTGACGNATAATEHVSVSRLEAERCKHVAGPFPDGESFAHIVERVSAFLVELVREWPSAAAVVIGHSATRLALEHLVHGTPLEDLLATPTAWQQGWRYLLGQRHSPSAILLVDRGNQRGNRSAPAGSSMSVAIRTQPIIR